MSLVLKREKTSYTPAPEGLHSAVCCDVEDLGEVDSPWGKKPTVKIYWQIEENNPDNENKPFIVSQRYNASLHEKSNLRKMLEAWRGKKYSDEELEAVDLEKLIGINCQVQVQHNIAGEGGVYANVTAVVPSSKTGVRLRVSQDYVRRRDREERKAIENGERGGNGYHATDADVPF